MLSLIFGKGMSKKIAPGFFRFVSMLFNVTVNVIIFSIRGFVVGVFRVCMYALYKYCYF